MNFTRDQKTEAFDNLPKDLKAVIMSNTLVETFQKIGNENKLSVDKIGSLGELVIVTMLGLAPREDFEKNVQKELGVNEIQASTITKSINENVFLRTQEILQKEEAMDTSVATEKTEEAVGSTTSYTDLNKESILSEIENPTDTVHPISAAREIGGAEPLEILPETTETHESVAHDFISGKLSETVSLPSQRTEVSPQKPTEKPKNYSADPYREPIN